MGISKQIGWGPEANLYYQISQQLERLIGVTSKVVLGPPAPPPPPIPTVTIGTQNWMTRNLNVTRYRNGDIIPQVTDTTQWANLTTGAWCYYENNSANGPIYGKLYNWFAVNDPRGLAPEGFHIPSNAEMTTLKGFLDPDAGGQMKEVGIDHWTNPNEGATNSSGWTGLGAGYRDNLNFNALQVILLCWVADEINYNNAYCFYLFHSIVQLNIEEPNSKTYGFSVRCLKD